VREYAPWSIRGAGAVAGEAPAGGGVGWDYATAWSFHPRELLSFLVPGWFGLKDQTYWGPMPFTHSTHYFGLLALLLAVYGLWRRPERRRWIWAGISAVVLFIGFGRHLPVLYGPMFHIVPYFDKFRVPSMIYGVLPFCLAWPIAGGMDALLRDLRGAPAAGGARGASRGEKGGRKGKEPGGRTDHAPASSRAGRRLVYALGAAVLLWVVLALAGRGAGLVRPDETRLGGAALAELRSLRLGILERSLAQSMIVLLLALGAAFLAARGARNRPAGWAALVLAVLAVGDVCLVGRQLYHVAPRPTLQEAVPVRGASGYLARQPGPFRILPAGREIFSSNAFALAGIESVGGYHPAKLRAYQDLIGAELLTSPAVLKMLNVRYLVAPGPMQWSAAPLFEGDGWVYPWPDSLPRAWSVPRVEAVSGSAALLARLGDEQFDPAQIALVYAADGPAPVPGGEARVALLGHEPGRVRLRVEAGGPAFVVLSEMAYPPGWRALASGREIPIRRVNHVLQGIELPAGDHDVEFTFRSPARILGQRISRAAGGLALLLAAAAFFLQRRGRHGSASAVPIED